jgi:hypothetical protein
MLASFALANLVPSKETAMQMLSSAARSRIFMVANAILS